MIKKPPAASMLFITLLSLFLVSGVCQSASQTVITDGGREVLLEDNGNWTFRSSDRYANTRDGRRIRLKQNGSWQYADDAPRDSTQHMNHDIKLQKVVIEKYVKKGFRNTRVKTQTVFYLQLNNFQLAMDDTRINEAAISLIEIKDNNGKNYPIISIKLNAENTVILRAEKSPTILDDARSMEITLKAGVFGIKNPMTLSQRMVDFETVDVDGFE